MNTHAQWANVPLRFALVITCFAAIARADDLLPMGPAPQALAAPWFPDRVHTFVWRNWESADLARMAEVLSTTPERVGAIGRSMGLPPHVAPTEEQRRRGYITTIRRNWHLLPYEQLLMLLGWTPEQMATTLKEDDFLWVKLGRLKPASEPLRYAAPSEAAQSRSARIKAIVEANFADELARPAQPRFAFVRELSQTDAAPPAAPSGGPDRPIRMLYSYFAIYGDPLTQPDLDPYPDGLLEKLARQGVNAVWMHTVLRDLAPSSRFPEFGQGHEQRLENLRRLVQRARRYGIDIILYMNEPRAMPPAFFEQRTEMKGAAEDNHFAMCTSVPAVHAWMTEALAYVFRQVPDLGGVFTITASENLTNCPSRGGQAQCPRCSKRPVAEIIAEVNRTITAGVRQGNPDARVIVWDWGWPDDATEAIIAGLPDNVRLMSVSEWSLPIERGGVKHRVGEYSISAVGPGPRAQRNWSLASKRGLKPMAKVQVNCTWELSAVPALPTMNLVAQHCANLRELGSADLMLSWTLGGYPSTNLELVRRMMAPGTAASMEDVLRSLAQERYGRDAAEPALTAWATFSRAFAEFPYDGTVVYAGPQQWGPANPLYPEPTGYHATMVGIPYDNVDGWRGPYPVDVFQKQFDKIARGWQEGMALFEIVVRLAGDHAPAAREDLRLAEAAGLHFRSVANQIRFTRARNALKPGQTDTDRQALTEEIQATTRDEIALARRMFDLTREDARIGFEASNHYYYLPVDLMEKVIACTFVLEDWLPAVKSPANP
ncbi:MAG: hypothetical protein AMXMBFR13_22070 [Phycisphaerae bacterium]